MAARRLLLLLLSDFAISFMWVWSRVLVKIFVHRKLGYGAHQFNGEIIGCVIYILNMFFFGIMGKLTKGGAYNPLAVLSHAISGDFFNFLFALAARIPTQVVGSVYGVRLILFVFPGIEYGPPLNVDVAKGALMEGLLTFSIVIISLGLSRTVTDSFFMRTWISSISKLSLHILGSDLTGGYMNPASVLGWTFARGEGSIKEHLIVYCLAPVEATLIAAWIIGILYGPKKYNARIHASSPLKPMKSH